MAASMKIDLKSKVNNPSPATAFSIMLGGNTNQKDIQELEISQLTPYPNQPFKPYTQEKLHELSEDIRINGVLSPVIVRPLDDLFQILAGHNRVNASKLAGLATVPCIVKNFDDDMAQLVLVNTNLNQRQELLPSEKAFAYKMQMNAIKQQGKRTDLTLSPLETKLNSAHKIADDTGDSRANIFRYIRLTQLESTLLNLVDISEIPMRAGVELSYLDEATQTRLLEYIEVYKTKIDLKTAELLRTRSHDGELTRNEIFSLLSKPPKPTKEKTAVKLKTASLHQYFPDKRPKEIEREISAILEQYFAQKGK